MLKINSVYKQGKNYHAQVYVEECKYTDAESQQWKILFVKCLTCFFFCFKVNIFKDLGIIVVARKKKVETLPVISADVSSKP